MRWPRLIPLAVAAFMAEILSSLGVGSSRLQAEFDPCGSDSSVSLARVSSVERPKLTVAPTTGVPNQSVVLIGTNFSSVSTPGDPGSGGTHQITGAGASIITAGGKPLVAPYINYPFLTTSLRI